MRIIVTMGLMLFLFSCATGPYPVTSPYFQIPQGSVIELTQTLTIPPNRARVYIQHGKVVTEKEKDRYQANCWFLSWKLLASPQTIKPDIFTVVQSQKNEDLVQDISYIKLVNNVIDSNPDSYPRTYASKKIDLFGGDAPIATEYTTQMFIHSDKQPNIRLLECSHWDDPHSGEHLTLDQMQQALGQLARIRLN